MFTGIVTDVGHIKALEQRGDWRVMIGTRYDTAGIEIGASIACSGVCLTVVDKGPGWFAVDVSQATLESSALGGWREGSAVNLERSVRVGDELGGHIVTGHADGAGRILAIEQAGDSRRFRFAAPPALAGYIAAKGSIAINGVSLTVNNVEDQAEACVFDVNIIPHTQAMTNFAAAQVGDAVNIEVDILARYVARLREIA
ncbi:MAG: riboflavin synthase [Sphingomonadales bacterium]